MLVRGPLVKALWVVIYVHEYYCICWKMYMINVSKVANTDTAGPVFLAKL